MLVTCVLGSIHAFSVFIAPLEDILHAPRADISLLYSGALVCLTVMVLVGHRLYSLASPPVLIAIACFGAASGTFIAANAGQWWLLFMGYSVLFGAANGLGYGFVLQLVARCWPERKGFAMGAVTATYAVGATIFSWIYARLIDTYSVSTTFSVMSLVLVLTGIVTSSLIYFSKARYQRESQERASGKPLNIRHIVLLWIGYGFSVAAGLMAIGHATGIVHTKGASLVFAVLGAMFIGLGNAVGGFVAGWLADIWPLRRLLVGLPLLSAAMLFLLATISNPSLAVLALAIIGLAYGAIIAVYPYAVAIYFDEHDTPKAYGRVFTAWGLAGLAAPWMAGKLFDANGNYTLALIIAASAALVSVVSIFLLTESSGQ